MFTGIIEQLGRIQATHATPAGVRLVVDPQGWAYRARVGDSVSVNGCCLTVAADPAAAGGALAFDVIPETLRKTTIGDLKAGAKVHLEHAATPTTLLGGHVVQGHIDGVGEVIQIAEGRGQRADVAVGEWRVRIGLPGDLMAYVVPKGSVAVDGVSLTVAGLGRHAGTEARRHEGEGQETKGRTDEGSSLRAFVPPSPRAFLNWFEVALIPTTLAKTTLGELAVGSRVNVECDVMAKTVVEYLRHYTLGGGHSGGAGFGKSGPARASEGGPS